MPPRFRFPEEARHECVLAFTAHAAKEHPNKRFPKPEWRIQCYTFGTRQEALRLLMPNIVLCTKVQESDVQPILDVYKGNPTMRGFCTPKEVREALLPIVQHFLSSPQSTFE